MNVGGNVDVEFVGGLGRRSHLVEGHDNFESVGACPEDAAGWE